MRYLSESKNTKSKTVCRLTKFLLINTTLMSLCAAASPAVFLPSAQGASTAAGAKHSKDAERSGGRGRMLALTAAGKPVGQCPLKHTSVSTKISGYVARVTVKQTFTNPYKNKIEAIYTFPLSESGAVDSMTMKVGNRLIKGTIKKREEAKQIYEAAKSQGHVASLLDQERTNIFTQSVANIEPGATIDITLTYVELLKYDAGRFTYTFPTVVGPRFIPGDAAGKEGTGWANDTAQVPDGSKLTPPVTPPGTRAGHDISIDVDVDAGVPLQNISSKLHEINVQNVSKDEAKVTLKDKDTIPNKDFVLSWDVSGDDLKSGYLTHRESKTESGYFTLMLLPPKRVTVEKVAPKEMIFLIDCSGSQSGAPLEKAKDTLHYIVDHMNPQDSFQIIAFANQQKLLYAKPQQVTGARKVEANKFIKELEANGGTWMGPAVEKACAIPADEHRLRIVTFMTDGYVGNDLEILGLIKKHRNTSRWFSFGTGDSVNRMLIDGIANEGGGEADYVLLNTSGAEVGKKFYDRISSPVLTDVSVDFGKLDVKEVFPKDVSDVWAEKPLYIKGRYLSPGAGTVTLKGFVAGKPYTQTLNVNLPEINHNNEVLGSIWARAKVDRLMSEDYQGAQTGSPNKELKDEIIKTALDHHIMTNYTSFVAVEEKVTTRDGKSQTVVVPVEMPEGVDRNAVFGNELGKAPVATAMPSPMRGYPMKSFGYARAKQYSPAPGSSMANFSKGIIGSGSGGGIASQESVEADKPFARDVREATAKKEEKNKVVAEPKKDELPKLDTQLQQLFDAKAAGKSLPAVKGCDGKFVSVSIDVQDTSAETLKKLKAAGFELKTVNGKQVIGRLKIENLKKLIALNEVKFVRTSEM